MKKFILSFFILLTISLQANKTSWVQFQKKTLKMQEKVDGWCGKEKAKKLMNLIYKTKPKVCVEIGVFGGSSVFPMAKTLSFLQNGKIYAIDPWSTEECLKGYKKDNPNYGWWEKVNLNKIFNSFEKLIDKHNLSNFCVIMRMNSEKAKDYFENESIDILHIDGNHTEECALYDVKTFFPKVKKGGYIWFDDANWESTQKAVEFLKDNCHFYPKGSIKSSGQECFLFQKRKN